MQKSWSELLFLRWQGKLTDEQETAFSNWEREHPERKKTIEELSTPEEILKGVHRYARCEDPALKDRIKARINEALQTSLNGNTVLRTRRELGRLLIFRQWKTYLRVAILLLIASSAFLWTNSKKEKQPLVTNTNQRIAIEPGKSNAILQLADGQLINLDSINNGSVTVQQGATIVKNNSLLAYNATEANESQTNTLITPRGTAYQLILPDGSHVWLNADSKLKYPVKFQADERKVFLEGEAYFEISHNKKAPFRVVLGRGESVEVLGTHFNVSSYQNEPRRMITLLQGKVKVQNTDGKAALLQPGQQAELISEQIEVSNDVDVANAVAWKNGFFRFNYAPMDVVMRQLERWYNVDISLKGEFPLIVASVPRSLEMSGLLKALQESGQGAFDVKIENRHVTITSLAGKK